MKADAVLSQGQLGRSAAVPSSVSALSSQRSSNLFSRTQQSSTGDTRQEKKKKRVEYFIYPTLSLWLLQVSIQPLEDEHNC